MTKPVFGEGICQWFIGSSVFWYVVLREPSCVCILSFSWRTERDGCLTRTCASCFPAACRVFQRITPTTSKCLGLRPGVSLSHLHEGHHVQYTGVLAASCANLMWSRRLDAAVATTKSQGTIQFVSWSPTDSRCGIHQLSTVVKDGKTDASRVAWSARQLPPLRSCHASITSTTWISCIFGFRPVQLPNMGSCARVGLPAAPLLSCPSKLLWKTAKRNSAPLICMRIIRNFLLIFSYLPMPARCLHFDFVSVLAIFWFV